MRIFLAVLDDGSIRFRGLLEAPDHGSHFLVSPKGDDLCGLPYDELIQYAWIETDDAGVFASGEKRALPDLEQQLEIPAFLRKAP